MGADKRYYYIKRKTHSPAKSESALAKPQIIWHRDWVTQNQSVAAERVLDLDFSAREHPKLLIGVLRWSLLVVTAGLVYMLGSALAMSGDDLKSSLTRRGEAAASQLQQGVESLKKLEFSEALRNFKLADKNFTVALNDCADLGQQHLLMAGLALDRSELLQGQEVLLSGRYLATAGAQATSAIVPLVDFWQNVGKDGKAVQDVGTQVGQLLLKNAGVINQSVANVSAATDTLNRISTVGLSSQYAELINQAKADTQRFKGGVQIASVLAQKLPDALGFPHPRYYLLMNQNDSELRPTGGFMGSVTLIKVQDGKIADVFVDDSYRIDGQLVGPLSAKKVFPNANFDPNFVTSATNIAKLYQQSGGGSLDGLVAINTQVMGALLTVVGDVYLPERGITVTPQNFSEVIHQEIQEVQDSSNPKQVLSELLPIVVNRLFSANAEQLSKIGQNILGQLVANNISIYLSDPELEDVVRTAGWSGEIASTNDLTDYLYVVEANMGSNKSTASMTREFSHQATIGSSGEVSDYLKLTYRHNGGDQFPDGPNKNYVRVYLPVGTKVNKLTGYDADTQIDTSVSDGKTIVGFWVTTQPKSNKTIEMEYVLPFRIDLGSNPKYQLLVEKQPGMQRTSLTSRINLSENISFQPKASDRYLTWFSGELNMDLVLTKALYRQ